MLSHVSEIQSTRQSCLDIVKEFLVAAGASNVNSFSGTALKSQNCHHTGKGELSRHPYTGHSPPFPVLSYDIICISSTYSFFNRSTFAISRLLSYDIILTRSISVFVRRDNKLIMSE